MERKTKGVSITVRLVFWATLVHVWCGVGWSAAPGSLSFVAAYKNGEGDVIGLEGAMELAVSPDGAHVYVAGYKDDSLAVFRRNPADGTLTFVEVVTDEVDGVDGLYGASGVTVSPDGKHVYATGTKDDAVAVFGRNPDSGELTFVQVVKDGDGEVDGLDGATSVAITPDGNQAYIAGGADGALAVFQRDTGTGELTFVEVVKAGPGGVDALANAAFVTLSPDGKHVYVAANGFDTLVAFQRDAATGEVTFIEAEKDGVNGVDGLGGATSVKVSPDGGYVYVAAYADDSVAVFRREAATGELTFVEVKKDGVDGVDGLGVATSVALDPSGGYVYVTGNSDDAVAVFQRDATTGELTFVELQKNGVGGVDGLHFAYSVMVSPDGRHLYVAGYGDNAVAVFAVETAGEIPAAIDGIYKDDEQTINAYVQTYAAGSVLVILTPDLNAWYVFLDPDVADGIQNLPDLAGEGHTLTMDFQPDGTALAALAYAGGGSSIWLLNRVFSGVQSSPLGDGIYKQTPGTNLYMQTYVGGSVVLIFTPDLSQWSVFLDPDLSDGIAVPNDLAGQGQTLEMSSGGPDTYLATITYPAGAMQSYELSLVFEAPETAIGP